MWRFKKTIGLLSKLPPEKSTPSSTLWITVKQGLARVAHSNAWFTPPDLKTYVQTQLPRYTQVIWIIDHSHMLYHHLSLEEHLETSTCYDYVKAQTPSWFNQEAEQLYLDVVPLPHSEQAPPKNRWLVAACTRTVLDAFLSVLPNTRFCVPDLWLSAHHLLPALPQTPQQAEQIVLFQKPDHIALWIYQNQKLAGFYARSGHTHQTHLALGLLHQQAQTRPALSVGLISHDASQMAAMLLEQGYFPYTLRKLPPESDPPTSLPPLNLLPWREKQYRKKKRVLKTLLISSFFLSLGFIGFIHHELTAKIGQNDQHISILSKNHLLASRITEEKRKEQTHLQKKNWLMTHINVVEQHNRFTALLNLIFQYASQGISFSNYDQTGELIQIQLHSSQREPLVALQEEIENLNFIQKAILSHFEGETPITAKLALTLYSPPQKDSHDIHPSH